jgi:predicted kinase
MATLFLMCGLPGAGKTTRAKRLAEQVLAVRLCPDEWLESLGFDLFDEAPRERLEALFWRHAQDLLRLGQSVILESGFWLRADRDEKRLGARELGVRVELHYLTAPIEELARRVAGRATIGISSAMLEGYARLFQTPDAGELALFDVNTRIEAGVASGPSRATPIRPRGSRPS